MGKSGDEGFTLIELMVVVLILGILMAIAIPTFLSLTSSAKTNAAESDLTVAAQDEATLYTTTGTYDTSAALNLTDTTVTPNTGVQTIDSGLNWTAQPAVGSASTVTAQTKSVGVTWVSANDVILQTLAQNGNYYWVNDAKGTLTYAYGTSSTIPTTGSILGQSWSNATALAAG